jgi:hypothetical protein
VRLLCQQKSSIFRRNRVRGLDVALTDREREWGVKASRFLKAELKRADIGYKELAERLNRHGLQETETSITGKLARGTFAASFFLACLAVLEMEGISLADL